MSNRFTRKPIEWEEAGNGCWVCNSHCKSREGYANVKVDGRMMKVHRLVFEECFGVIPEGLEVCHKCDNPGCINPEHLFLGTHADNMKDRGDKGRQAKGMNIGTSKLPVFGVSLIKNTRALPARILSRAFGVNERTIYSIRSNKLWKHV